MTASGFASSGFAKACKLVTVTFRRSWILGQAQHLRRIILGQPIAIRGIRYLSTSHGSKTQFCEARRARLLLLRTLRGIKHRSRIYRSETQLWFLVCCIAVCIDWAQWDARDIRVWRNLRQRLWRICSQRSPSTNFASKPGATPSNEKPAKPFGAPESEGEESEDEEEESRPRTRPMSRGTRLWKRIRRTQSPLVDEKKKPKLQKGERTLLFSHP